MRRFAAVLPLLLAACSDPPPAAVTQTPPAQPAPVTASTTPPPPTAAPMAPTTAPAAAGAASFTGHGSATFGMDEAALRAAHGTALVETPENEGCYLLWPTGAASPSSGAFMFDQGKFVRYSTDAEGEAAPGGGKVGMTEAEIQALYAGRVEQQPHKYVDGHYLRIKDAAGGNGVLIFETDDAQGGKVTSWRVGVEPQIDYVEGCS